jgi:hypothetical protein
MLFSVKAARNARLLNPETEALQTCATVPVVVCITAVARGASGKTIHKIMYSSKPTPPQNSAISHTTRMRVGSKSKYSANPAQTPPSFLSVLERIKRLPGAGVALTTPGCRAPHAEQNLDPSGISFAQFTQYIFHPPQAIFHAILPISTGIGCKKFQESSTKWG